MARLPVIAAAVLAIAASAPMTCVTATPVSAEGWRDRDFEMDREDLRDLPNDRIRTRQDLRDLIIDLMRDREGLRGRLRERIDNWRDDDEEGWRGRLRERINDRREREDEGEDGWRGRLRGRGLERGECLIITRSVRDEDRDFMVLVRRRVCPD